jgi:transposase
MSLKLLAIDLGKLSFHVHGITADGTIVSRKISRGKLSQLVSDLDREIVAMEACGGAHHWGREFVSAGRQVRLIHPRFVKPFVRGSKNDAVDAEAIYDAATRPTMRFVPLKSLEQQDLQTLHRVRERLIVQRTSLINHARGLLAEYGLVLPKGPTQFALKASAILASASVSDFARKLFHELFDQLQELERRLAKLDAEVISACRENEMGRRLSALPGVGPIIATALVASVADGRHFRNGRELAAWIGLVPRRHTTGGKPKLGGIGRRANHDLRKQLIHGARSVLYRLPGRGGSQSRWLQALVERRGHNRAVVKTARTAWALLAHGTSYAAA